VGHGREQREAATEGRWVVEDGGHRRHYGWGDCLEVEEHEEGEYVRVEGATGRVIYAVPLRPRLQLHHKERVDGDMDLKLTGQKHLSDTNVAFLNEAACLSKLCCAKILRKRDCSQLRRVTTPLAAQLFMKRDLCGN
jgi:hypothetical protein